MRAKEGTVFPFTNRSGKTVWKVEVTVGYHPDGRRRRIRRTADTKTEALRLKNKLLQEAESGELAINGNERLDEFASWWFETVKKAQVRPPTYADYVDRYLRWIKPVFGRRPLADITVRDVANWMANLERHGYTPKTINGSRQILHMILQAAVVFERLKKNPLLAVPAKRGTSHSPRIPESWNRQEALLALRACQGTNLELPVTLGLVLGLRRGEILGLRWSDFDFDAGTITIQRTRREYREITLDGIATSRVETTPTKSFSSNRTLRMGSLVQRAVMTQREIQQSRGFFSQDGWVFATRTENPIAPTRLAKLFQEFQKRNGLRRIRFHDLRHSAAGLSLSAGTRLEAVSQVLGHSRVDITKSVYAPKVSALGDEYALNIDDYLGTEQNFKQLGVVHVK